MSGSLQLGFYYLSTFISALQAYTDANWAGDIIDRSQLLLDSRANNSSAIAFCQHGSLAACE